eukprot:TRINITY_DN14303_c0_g1_i1.p2 TRINITY_DN14303_c0_g1~~TRINITY_DN14303_c0_g1_i1.p2  ORF type:complete len:101 (-),score=16.28 TRINITY_DN14303_c0_g1_i1:172-474(-)
MDFAFFFLSFLLSLAILFLFSFSFFFFLHSLYCCTITSPQEQNMERITRPIVIHPTIEVTPSDFGSIKQLRSRVKRRKASSEQTEEYWLYMLLSGRKYVR